MMNLDSLSWLQLTKVPRPVNETRPTGLRRQIFASLAGAHAELLGGADQAVGTLAFCCLRPAGCAAFSTWLAVRRASRLRHARSGRTAPGRRVGTCPSCTRLVPPESRLPPPRWPHLDSLPLWTPCLGEADVLWAPGDDSPQAALRAPFDDYVAHLPDAFGWLVIAEPLSVALIEAERNRLMGRIPLLRQRENSEVHRIELERTQARYRELTKARTSGVWSVKVLVGGPDVRASADGRAAVQRQ